METLTTSTLSPGEAALAGGIIGGSLAMFAIIGIVCWILAIIAQWKIFEKAGEKGWKALIPIYNTYILYKIVDMTNWFWALLAISFVLSIGLSLSGYGVNMSFSEASTYNAGANPLLTFILLATMLFSLVVSIMYAYRTAKVFGKGIGFTIGLILLPNIFWLILGFGKAKYNKKRLHD